MASMGGMVNTFSIQTSMAAPEREEGCLYTVSERCRPKRGAPFCAPLASRSFLPGRPGWVFGIEGSTCLPAAGKQVDPSPRLRLGTFNGRRPTRESLIGNGGGAPPVSRFLYRPALWANKKRKSREILLGSVSDYATYQELLTRCGDIPIGVEPVPFFSQLFIRQSMGQRSGLDYAQPSITLKPNNYLCPRVSSK